MDYSIVRNYCAEIIQKPTKESVSQFRSVLENCERNQLRHLRDSVLYALCVSLDPDKRNNQEIKELLVACIKTLVKTADCKNVIQFKTIIGILLSQICDSDTKIRPNLSEEFKLGVLECLDMVFRCSSPEYLMEFYIKENNMLVAHIVYVSVEIISLETYRKLRIAAVNCLLSIFYVYDEAVTDPLDVVLRQQVSHQTFVMLPKVVATLQNVIFGDEKQGRLLIMLALKALGRILLLIFDDYNKDNCDDADLSIKDFQELIAKSAVSDANQKTDSEIWSQFPKHKSVEEKTKYMNALQNSPEWQVAAIKKLRLTLEHLRKLSGNQNEDLRLEMAIQSCNLLENTPTYLHSHLTSLLEAVIALSQDECPKISKKCLNTITTITNRKYNTHTDNMDALFQSHLIQLPRIIYAGDVEDQLAALLLLKGLITLMAKSKLKVILSCRETMDRFMVVLISSCELDRSIALLHEEHSNRAVDDTQSGLSTMTPWKEFRNARHPHFIELISEICHILGRSNASDIVFAYLMDMFTQNDSSCNEILVLLQFMLAMNGWGETERIEICLEELLSDRHWDLDIQPNRTTNLEMEEFGETNWYEDRTAGLYESAISIRYTDVRWNGPIDDMDSIETTISINDAKFNVQHICLILETVGLFSLSLKELFNKFMLRSLHRILEKTGSSNYVIHTAGAMTLNNLRLGLHFANVSELIHVNVDYIAYFVNIALKRVNESKNALDILGVVLKYSSLESVPHLENIITTVLDESSKSNQARNISSFLKVFHIILLGIRNWTNNPTIMSPAVVYSEEDEEAICQKWLNMLESNQSEELTDTDRHDDVHSDDVLAEDQEEQPTAELPLHVQITATILKRCIKYISSRSKMDKCLVLDIIFVGLEVIGPHENELLPMVHAIWPPFVERLKDRDAVILRRCFSLLVLLGHLAKDFLYKRTTKDVFPFTIDFLKQTWVDGMSRRDDHSYESTQQFKLVCELFAQLPQLITDLDVAEKDLDQILDAAVPYLNNRQHIEFQQSCIDFMRTLRVFDAAAIYIKIHEYRNEENSQFAENVNKIFKNK